ncbi:hypothetical protein SLE2022_144400 [Rubroshorea leprosula]
MDYNYRHSSRRLTIFAHFFGVLAFILMLIWLLHYRGGLQYDSYDNYDRVFNVHPFLMYCAFIFLAGEAMMAYKTIQASHHSQKIAHMVLHLSAFILGVIGISAVFKFHDMAGIEDMYSLHSWIGLSTFCLFGMQWLFGLFSFFSPAATQETRMRVAPLHRAAGRALLYLSICAALTGIIEKFTFQRLKNEREARLMNFMGLSILLFGIFVDLSVALARDSSPPY